MLCVQDSRLQQGRRCEPPQAARQAPPGEKEIASPPFGRFATTGAQASSDFAAALRQVIVRWLVGIGTKVLTAIMDFEVADRQEERAMLLRAGQRQTKGYFRGGRAS